MSKKINWLCHTRAYMAAKGNAIKDRNDRIIEYWRGNSKSFKEISADMNISYAVISKVIKNYINGNKLKQTA